MAKQTINLGTGELTGDGESIRSAFDKVNDNFDEIYARDLNTDAQTLSVDGNTISITGGNSITIAPAVSLDGDVTGSVFGDDSTLLVDGINNKIVGAVDTASLRTSDNNIALGNSAGFTNQGAYGIALGFGAGDTNQGQAAISIGYTAGQTTQGNSAIAIGPNAGNTTQGIDAVAIGVQAGLTTQGQSSVAIGQDAGQETQGAESVAIGKGAGETTQGTYAQAVGNNAGNTNQGQNAVAIGSQAGENNQGIKAIALGQYAGKTNQAANSIVINATGVEVNNTTAESLVIKPIRSAVGTTIMMYDVTSGEVTHNTAIPYPANSGVSWDGVAPTTVDGAIDRLASYTQDFAVSTDAHWADPDPAGITDAINRLAAAIYALNGNTGI